MTASPYSQGPQQIYRIDKFAVPDSARREFIENVRSTHEFLRTLPGFIQDSVLEKTGGPGEFNFVTIAVWHSAEAIEGAKDAVKYRHEELGFSPQEMFARLGIKADLVNYRQIDV